MNNLFKFLLFLLLLLAGYLIWDASTQSYVDVTPTPTKTSTATPSETRTPSDTPTATESASPTPTVTATPTATAEDGATNNDPDYDGFIGAADACPDQWGPKRSADTDNPGCPVNDGNGGSGQGGSGTGESGGGDNSDGSDHWCEPWPACSVTQPIGTPVG